MLSFHFLLISIILTAPKFISFIHLLCFLLYSLAYIYFILSYYPTMCIVYCYHYICEDSNRDFFFSNRDLYKKQKYIPYFLYVFQKKHIFIQSIATSHIFGWMFSHRSKIFYHFGKVYQCSLYKSDHRAMSCSNILYMKCNLKHWL